MAEKRVYFFGGGKAEGNAKMKELLGGKGANLAEMTKLGVPVTPPEYDPEIEEKQVEAFHGLLVDRMAELMRQHDTCSSSSSTPQT